MTDRNSQQASSAEQARFGGAYGAGGAVYEESPWSEPALFEGVLTKRFFAFLIDLLIISLPIILASIFILIFGVITLGLGWALFWLVSPASVVWAVVYYGMSLGGPHSATVGMRMMGLQLRTWKDEPGYFVLGAAHAVLYWLSVSFLTPAVLLVGLFNQRGRLLHDIVLGVVIINSAPREAFLQASDRARTL